MSSLVPAGILLVINLGLVWLLMAAPIGWRTITLRKRLPSDRQNVWNAIYPLGTNSAWSPSILASEPVAEQPGLVRQAYTYPDRKGRPIVRTLEVGAPWEGQNEIGFEMRIVDDSALDRSHWRNYQESRVVRGSEGHADIVVTVTDRYRGLAMYLFRYFALRRELAKLGEWLSTGHSKPGGLIEHPVTQAFMAILSTMLLWPFFGFSQFGLMLSTMLTVVIVLHELGHMAAYRAFGHQHTRMIFVPLLGGIAIGGRPYNSHFEVATCALMGPGLSAMLVPITIAAYAMAAAEGEVAMFAQPILLFLLVLGAFNLLNLLPMSRFDGGQVLRQVFTGKYLQIAGSFGITAVILGIGWRIGLPATALQAGLAVFTLMSLMGAARMKPREALDPMSPAERLLAAFGLYSAVAIHGYAIVFACDHVFR